MDTIGFLELTSIAGGVKIADEMLKTGRIELIFAKASCPGKYYIMVHGQVSDVKSSVEKGLSLGEGFVVSSFILPKVHPQIVKAVNMTVMPEKVQSIGVMEFYSVASSIQAADTAVKSANVDLIDLRLGTGIGGKSFVVLTGDTSSVTNAVKAGIRDHLQSGMLLNYVTIANPKKELIASLY